MQKFARNISKFARNAQIGKNLRMQISKGTGFNCRSKDNIKMMLQYKASFTVFMKISSSHIAQYKENQQLFGNMENHIIGIMPCANKDNDIDKMRGAAGMPLIT